MILGAPLATSCSAPLAGCAPPARLHRPPGVGRVIARPGQDYVPISLDTGTECVNQLLRDAARAAHASVLDIDTYLCPGHGHCGSTLDGQELRPDGLHFGNPGGHLPPTWVVLQLIAPPPWPPGAARRRAWHSAGRLRHSRPEGVRC